MNGGFPFSELQTHFAAQLPFVAYRKPNEKGLKAFLQKSDTINFLQNFNQKGFIISRFDNAKPTIIFLENDCRVITGIYTENEKEFSSSYVENYNETEKGRQRYLRLVNQAMDKIKNDNLEKIVLSRVEALNLDSLEVFEIFRKLLINHPEAFVYMWYHPKFGIWLGASPEQLLKIKNNRLETVALAGTKSSEDIPWKEKEYREQQLVTDFLKDNLTDLMVDIRVSSTKTVKAGNLFHLKTEISGALKNADTDLRSLIERLHPTPAVCGVPRDPAKKFILENENYDREFYTGFLGELNLSTSNSRKTTGRNIENRAFFNTSQQTDLYVNLRCVKILDGISSVFVGGGITSDSIPEEEWQETIRKTSTMKNVLS